MTDIRRPLALLLAALATYALLLGPFTDYMKHKPIEEKLGYLPATNVLKYCSADHREFVAASLVMKVVMYFGGMTEKQAANAINLSPDYRGMSRILHTAVQLNPYNLDAYYFAQSFLSWEVKQYKVANDLLDYGMKYRTWDWYLPFFAGFNSAYFLKDYPKAATYYKRAGELSGSDLYKRLAGRYLQVSGQTELAIVYLSAMEKGERNPAVKKNYQVRLEAFKQVRRIEMARNNFLKSGAKLPFTLDDLVRAGMLGSVPVDPYGGEFYLEPDGRVATTSKFAYYAGSKNP